MYNFRIYHDCIIFALVNFQELLSIFLLKKIIVGKNIYKKRI